MNYLESNESIAQFESFLHSLVPNDPALLESVFHGFDVIFEEIRAPTPANLSSWLADSVIKQPLFHATGRQFDKFDSEKTSAESYLGKGIYLSTSTDDVKHNYANKKGPDINNRIELAIEHLTDNYFGDEFRDMVTEYLKNTKPGYTDEKIDSTIDKLIEKNPDGLSKSMATKIAHGIYSSAFRTIPVYARLTNPIMLTKDGTYFDFNYPYEPDYTPDDDDAINAAKEAGYDDYDDYYRVKLDEYYDNQEPSGKLAEFIEGMRNVLLSDGHESDVRQFEEIAGHLMENYSDGAPATKVIQYIKEKFYIDEPPVGQAINLALREMGYDGIIMDPDPKWKMKNIPTGTFHVIVFDAENIRSAFTGQPV